MSYNIELKRDAPYRGGFESLLFFQLRWLRQASAKGAPLSFTLCEILEEYMKPEFDLSYLPARGPVLLLSCMDLRLMDFIVPTLRVVTQPWTLWRP
jgi:hypothetical protein